jgi:hypothetical protein
MNICEANFAIYFVIFFAGMIKKKWGDEVRVRKIPRGLFRSNSDFKDEKR